MLSLPSENEIEISIFGPGYGECILVHIGINKWIVIDSCINPDTKKPRVLEYLKVNNIAFENIVLIIATHWHDDHVRGLSQVVKACKNAKFVISEALRSGEFVRLASLFSIETMMKSSSGLDELTSILDILHARKSTPIRAIANRPIFTLPSNELDINSIITPLSPSDKSVQMSTSEIGKLIPLEKSEIRRLPSLSPNHSTVVIWISINNINVLLGSDLENSNDNEMGWLAILDSNSRPTGKACIFKIPHHGSLNSDEPKVWEKMLIENPYSVLTPFKNGSIKLPKISDIKRIIQNTNNAYSTADIADKTIKSGRELDKFMKKIVKNRKIVFNSLGHVRIRLKIDEDINEMKIKLFNGAKKLDEMIEV